MKELIDELISMYICGVEISEDYSEGEIFVTLTYQNGNVEELCFKEGEEEWLKT